MTNQQTPERPVEQLIAALKWQAQENGCYCETDISADEAGIPIGERCPYCLMGKACQELEALASRAVPSTGEAEATGRVPSAWSEWGDGHDYSRSGKHDPNECRSCLRHVIKRLEAQPFADRMVQAEARVATLVSLAKRATNGWACYATTPREHDEIAKLHREIDATLKSAAPSEPPAPAASNGAAPPKCRDCGGESVWISPSWVTCPSCVTRSRDELFRALKVGSHGRAMERIAELTSASSGAAPQEWQPIETLDDPDREVLMWTPRERIYTPDQLKALPDLPAGEQRVSTRRHWTWATKWQPLPAPPERPTPADWWCCSADYPNHAAGCQNATPAAGAQE